MVVPPQRPPRYYRERPNAPGPRGHPVQAYLQSRIPEFICTDRTQMAVRHLAHEYGSRDLHGLERRVRHEVDGLHTIAAALTARWIGGST